MVGSSSSRLNTGVCGCVPHQDVASQMIQNTAA